MSSVQRSHNNTYSTISSKYATIQEEIITRKIKGRKDEGVTVEGVIFKDGSCTFAGPVTFLDEVHGIIKPVDCHACLKEQVPGFTWGHEDATRSLCMDCIYDSCLQFRAKESWAEQNGDPMKSILERLEKLEMKKWNKSYFLPKCIEWIAWQYRVVL